MVLDSDIELSISRRVLTYIYLIVFPILLYVLVRSTILECLPIHLKPVLRCHFGAQVMCSATFCPRYSAEIENAKDSPEMKQFYEEFDYDFLDLVEQNSGLKIPRDDVTLAIHVLYGLYDNLLILVRKHLASLKWSH